MPFYGAPELDIEYTFIATAPFDAEHPIGSGIVVHYEPGDSFPGEEWGMSAHNLVEVGKAVRLAKNVGAASVTAAPTSAPPVSTELTVEEVNEGTHVEDVTGYPVPGAAGWWTLSDGSKVRGEDAAHHAQAELDEGGGQE